MNYLQNRVEISEEVYEEILSDKKRTFRDFLWDYPTILAKYIVKLTPLSSIIIYTLLTIIFFLSYGNIKSSLENPPQIYAEKKSISEGTLGTISNLNPIFITRSQTDKDVQALVFQKLIKIDENGNPRPSIATRWRIEQDKVYTFYLRDDIFFSDGEKLTASDVKYTFDTAIYLSDKNGINTIGTAMEGITIDVIDDYTIKFTLKEQNATIFEVIAQYIVPQHYFEQSDVNILEYSWLNNKPVGSGPYRIAQNNGYSITLVPSEYYLVKPNIDFYEFRIYSSYEDLLTAYFNNKVDIVSNLDLYQADFANASVNFRQIDIELSNRNRLIYFNTRDKFKSVYLRQAISHLVDKQELINDVGVLAVPINGPISRKSWAYFDDPSIFYEYSPEKADAYLKSYGYTKDEQTSFYKSSSGEQLSFVLTYLDTPLNNKIAQNISQQLMRNGVILDIDSGKKTYDQLIREILPNRDFQMLLFEIETTIDPDQYNLWHSLKSDYPNLNISGPTEKSKRIDLLLEMARMTTKINGEKGRKEYYQLFQKYFMSDAPVLFLYNPTYSFFVSKNVIIPEQEYMAVPSDRFDNIVYWDKI